jgi:hypothetical protein
MNSDLSKPEVREEGFLFKNVLKVSKESWEKMKTGLIFFPSRTYSIFEISFQSHRVGSFQVPPTTKRVNLHFLVSCLWICPDGFSREMGGA